MAVHSKKCSFPKADGSACRGWAIKGTDYCASHSRNVGAPKGNKNRETHGFWSKPDKPLLSIDDVVADSLARQSELSKYIVERLAAGELAGEEMVTLLGLHGQNASRIGRLLRDQRVLNGGGGGGLDEFIDQVLAQIEL